MSVPTDTNVTVLPLQPTEPDRLSPMAAVSETVAVLHKQPVFIAGSAVAAMSKPGHADKYGDLDVFCPTQQVLFASVQSMLDRGYTLDDRFTRVWHRWLRHGFKGWHTNSIRLHSLSDVQVNVVYKLVGKQPLTSLSQVLESFDFGLLGVGVEVETNTLRDLRPYLFPGMDVDGPLPMMPNKRDDWRNGFISQYNGLRQAMRYAKYHGYGYDMSAVKDDLITGYDMAALYFNDSFDDDKRLLGRIYSVLARRVEDNEVDELTEAYKTIDLTDELDAIMEGLE